MDLVVDVKGPFETDENTTILIFMAFYLPIKTYLNILYSISAKSFLLNATKLYKLHVYGVERKLTFHKNLFGKKVLLYMNNMNQIETCPKRGNCEHGSMFAST